MNIPLGLELLASPTKFRMPKTFISLVTTPSNETSHALAIDDINNCMPNHSSVPAPLNSQSSNQLLTRVFVI